MSLLPRYELEAQREWSSSRASIVVDGSSWSNHRAAAGSTESATCSSIADLPKLRARQLNVSVKSDGVCG
jgi:hypothetical protein